jgi:hypothetical protein
VNNKLKLKNNEEEKSNTTPQAIIQFGYACRELGECKSEPDHPDLQKRQYLPVECNPYQ